MAPLRTLILALFAAGALAGPALPHAGGGGGGNGGGSGSGGGQDTPRCPAGYVENNGACQRVSQGVLPDDALYAQGRALALAGYPDRALPLLQAVRRTDDAMVFTMRGFALRKLGHFDAAMAEYDRALRLAPDNVNTHEYIGEAYVTVGRLDRARVELATVRRLCGPDCEQFEDLRRAIDTGVTE